MADPETPDQKKLASIGSAVNVTLLLVAMSLGTQCSRSDAGFQSRMGIRTVLMQGDLSAIKRQLDGIETQLKALREDRP